MLAWETAYFREHHLQGQLGLAPADLAPLDTEFAALNAAVAAQPRVLIHRDFQSRNILWQRGRVRLVDVQGMRLGPLGYDLASLVWDPYVDLDAALREALVVRFAAAVAPSHGLSVGAVETMVRLAALQRLMQALGAYGCLGTVRGKPGFLAHVPRGVDHLRQVLSASADDLAMPALTALLDRAGPRQP
jgi:aminoglycoside/choline kinase family phosphotransferase